MANDAEKRVRFDRVISALRGVIDSLTAQESAWEELKKGTVDVYADSAIACMEARQAFEDETPTMDALVIALRDNRYKDTTWPTDDMDDAKSLRIAWYAIHDTIEAGKSFARDDIGMMRNLCAALERARKSYAADPLTHHEQLLKWAQVTLGNSKEGELVVLIVAQGVTDKSKLREALKYGDSEARAFNTLLGMLNRKLKQGKKSRKIDAFYWIDGKGRECVKLLTGNDAKVRHAR